MSIVAYYPDRCSAVHPEFGHKCGFPEGHTYRHGNGAHYTWPVVDKGPWTPEPLKSGETFVSRRKALETMMKGNE